MTELLDFIKSDQIAEVLRLVIGVCVDVAWRLVASFIVLVVGRTVIRFFLKKLRNGKKFGELDPTVRSFLQNFIRIGSYVLLAVSIVAILGVPMASIITLFASAGAAVALAEIESQHFATTLFHHLHDSR